MNNQKFYYKIVRKSYDGNVTTLVSSNDKLPEVFTCKYELNKTTYPPIGKLFVFDTLDFARNFLMGCFSKCYVILKVKVTNPITHGFMLLPSHLVERNINSFWGKNSTLAATHIINGTVLVDSITPVEILNDDDSI